MYVSWCVFFCVQFSDISTRLLVERKEEGREETKREVGDWRDRESIDIKSPKRKAVNLLLLL